jgi:UDP-glucose 4-epimerase
MRVLVTGASGFIGLQLVPALAAAGHDVHALVRDSARLEATPDTSVVVVDLARPLERRSLPVVDAVVHLAQANVPFPDAARELYLVNTLSTQELLEYARQVGARRFVFASSGSIYGLGEAAVTEDEPRRSTDFYAVTKRNAEQLVEAYRKYFATAVLRPFTPYGPTQQGRLISGLVDRVRTGSPVTLNEGGRPRITPLFVDDLVRMLVTAVDLEGHQVVNLAGDQVVSIRDVALLVGEVLGRDVEFVSGNAGVGDLVAQNSLMHDVFEPGSLVPLEKGIRITALAEALA